MGGGGGEGVGGGETDGQTRPPKICLKVNSIVSCISLKGNTFKVKQARNSFHRGRHGMISMKYVC